VNHVSKATRITVLLLATVCMFALFVSSAYAYTGYWVPCATCHASAPTAIVPAVTAGAVTGDSQAYTVSAPGATEWAVFAGFSKLASGAGTFASFSVPVGTTYNFYAVAGSPTAGAYGTTAISPAYTWVEDPTDVTPPVSTSDAVASYVNSATIRIDATDDASGVAYIYYKVGAAGATRMTPVGVGGYAIAYDKPTSSGIYDYTLYFWSQDREGNIEDPRNEANFTIDASSGWTSTAVPSTITGPNGSSPWTYQDAFDATAKREGGYLAYGGTSGYYTNPHGGYDTTTNKCKTCHAVHRAEGTYYLLRASSSDDACDYCHVGGGAHSALVVYDANPGGKYTNNGHTMGAGSSIPDSSIEQAIEHITIPRVGEQDIEVPVRVYESEKKKLFRIVGFGRHPAGHPSFGYSAPANDLGGLTNPVYGAVGPLSLSCSLCHQTHNATALIWKPLTRGTTGYSAATTTRLTSGYKLLRRFPGASTAITVEEHYKEEGEPLSSTSLAKVPESTLLPYALKDLTDGDEAFDVAYPTAGSYGIAIFKDEAFTEATEGMTDAQKAAESSYVDWDGATWQSPDWAVNSHGWHDYDFEVQQYTLSYWCADCHNLNIGGRGVTEGDAELGFFKAHAERTHPNPASRGFQCYSCHRGSLEYNPGAGDSADMTGTSCTNCHFASNEYRTAVAIPSNDWPHSSGTDDYKLLGNFSLANAPSATGYHTASTTPDGTPGQFAYTKTTIGPDNRDAVGLRCHTDSGTMK
jgi:hypothetical protein